MIWRHCLPGKSQPLTCLLIHGCILFARAFLDTLIRSQGGAILAESVEGQGTTLHLYLPEVQSASWPPSLQS